MKGTITNSTREIDNADLLVTLDFKSHAISPSKRYTCQFSVQKLAPSGSINDPRDAQ
jgi:hypothetical protein